MVSATAARSLNSTRARGQDYGSLMNSLKSYSMGSPNGVPLGWVAFPMRSPIVSFHASYNGNSMWNVMGIHAQGSTKDMCICMHLLRGHICSSYLSSYKLPAFEHSCVHRTPFAKVVPGHCFRCLRWCGILHPLGNNGFLKNNVLVQFWKLDLTYVQ